MTMRVNAHSLVGWWLVPLCSVASLATAADDLRLVEAVKNQDKQAVSALLKQKVAVKATQPDGATALHWAVQWDDLDTTNTLIRAGADVNAANDYGVTPLSLACTNGNAAMIEMLLKSGASVKAASPITGETALMTAARTGKVDAVKVLLDHGADVDQKETSHGQTALMWAAAEGHAAVVHVLIERGADIHARSKAGFTPLLFAARTGDLELIQFLLGVGATVNEEAADGTTALLVATIRSHTPLAQFLLQKGADPNKGAGFTPLHWAAGNWGNSDTVADGTVRSDANEWSTLEGLKGPAKAEFVQLLLAHGADPNARAKGNPPLYGAGPARGGAMAGATPFWIAAKVGDANVMRVLANGGADPLLANNQQTTPLMTAAGVGGRGHSSVAENNALEAVKLCVELGNDVTAADAAGETALHGTAYRGLSGSAPIVQFLVAKGAKVNVKNAYGWMPLAIAEGIYFGGSDTRSDKAAELLRTLGAEPTPPDVERAGNVAALKARREKEMAR
jgi:ankyrin repeat protein